VLVIKSTETVDGEDFPMLIEVDQAPAESACRATRGATGRAVKTADNLFQDGLELARGCASKVASSIQAIDTTMRPDEFEVTLAIKIDVEGNAVLAKTSAGAQLDVRMLWKREPCPLDEPAPPR
jgi:hypothetical protein